MIFWVLFISALIAWVLLMLPRHPLLGLGASSLFVTLLIAFGYFHIMIIPFTLCLLFLGLFWLLKRSGRKWIGRFFLAFSIIFWALGGLALYILPIANFPSPTGLYAVGTTRLIVSETLPIQVWYPTETKTQNAPYLLEGPILIDGLANTLGLPSIALQHWNLITTPAQLDAPILQEANSFPTILFTHGLGGYKAQNTGLMLELASQGYIVIAVDQPTYAAATIVNQELILDQHPELVGAMISELDGHIDRWVGNMQLVLEELPEINTQFSGMLNLNRIAVIGHSYGGATAYQLLQSNQNIAAAVNMDGGFFGSIENSGKPFLLFNAESTLDAEAFTSLVNSISDEEFISIVGQTKETVLGNFDALLERRCQALGEDSLAVSISDIQHISFTDLPRLSPMFQSPVDPHPILIETIVSFFDATLYEDDSLLSINATVSAFSNTSIVEGCE